MVHRERLAVVAAGHASRGDDCIFAEQNEEGKPSTILKVLDETEFKVYSRLATTYNNDEITRFIPKFEGVVEDCQANGDLRRFIRIHNVLQDFHRPKVMDVKLGIRTFLESECASNKPRPDLFQRMQEKFPRQLTEEENTRKSITKHRWMTVRDSNSTTSILGYRIDGLAGLDGWSQEEIDTELARVQSMPDATLVFHTFARAASCEEDFPGLNVSKVIAEKLQQQFAKLHAAVEASAFALRHEVIGSSVLLVADETGKAGVYWIDFAKTLEVADGIRITHRSPWRMGNHEDGLLTGLANLADAWDQVRQRFYREDKAAHVSISSMTAENNFKLQDDEGSFKIKLQKTLSGMLGTQGYGSKGSDISTLSMLPSFSGIIADPDRKIWRRGNRAAKAAAASGLPGDASIDRTAPTTPAETPGASLSLSDVRQTDIYRVNSDDIISL